MKKPEGFIVRFENRRVFEKLTDEDAGILIKALLRYAQDGLEPDDLLPYAIEGVFQLMAGQIDRGLEAYAKTAKDRSEAGKKGAESRWG